MGLAMIRLVIPTSREGEPGAGQWKDLQSIRMVLDQLDPEWKAFRFDGQNLEELMAQLGDAEATVIWYYSFWPEALEALKARCPRVRLVLRTVNAEALQHWLRAGKDWRRLHGLPRDLYGGARLLLRDRRCAHAADVLAGISSWDDAHYWRWLGGRRKSRSVPYACPWPGLFPEVKRLPWEARENTIACLAGTRDAIGRAHLAGLASLARRPELSGWHFAVSDGFMDASADSLPADVERMGKIGNPWSVLCRVKVVAVLSPLGYGAKTTVTDALAAGCHVLIHPRQRARLSSDEQARTLPLDPAAPPDNSTLSVALSRPPGYDGVTLGRARMARSQAAWKGVLET